MSQTIKTHFENKVWNDGAEICVSAAFAEAVDGALNVSRTGTNSSQSSGGGTVAVIMGMDAYWERREFFTDGFCNLVNLVWQGTTVRSAKHQHVSTSVGNGGPHLHCLLAIFLITVEYMLGVENHLNAV